MAVSAAATAGYAYLVGPVLRSLFGAGSERGAPQIEGATSSRVLERIGESLAALEPLQLGAVIMAVAAVKGAAFFGQRSLSVAAGQGVLRDLRARLYQGLLALNPLSETARRRGNMVSRFTADAEAVEQGVAGGLLIAVRDGLQIAALAALALALDPVLGAIGLVAFPLAAMLIASLGRELRRRRGAVHASLGQVGETVEETAAGLDVARAFGAERLLRRRFEQRSERLARRAVRAALVRACSAPVNELLGAAALAATLWYARARIAGGALSPDALISFFTALLLLYQPVKGLGRASHAVQSALAALDRLDPLLKRAEPKPEPRRAPGGSPSIIRLENVRAGYGEGPDVLEDVSLELERGERVAVIGPSGAGKTTLLNVLCGFLPPRAGRLSIDGRRVSVSPESMRELVAPVFQEPFLFDDSIATNVRCGRSRAGDAELRQALRAAGVTEFAARRGLDTPVGRGGGALSVGQRQRVCLARALLAAAPVLLLDEVTASLDGAGEQRILDSLRRLEDRTVLIITHRVSTARLADRVVLLEEGRLRDAEPTSRILADDRVVEIGREVESA